MVIYSLWSSFASFSLGVNILIGCFETKLSVNAAIFSPFLSLSVKMFEWIGHNKELFLQTNTDIGVSYQHAADLQTQHDHFAMNSMVRRRNATRKQPGYTQT